MTVFTVNVVQFLFLTTSLLLIGIRAECNGGSHLCSRSYSNITHLVTHDSYALSPNLAATQEKSIIKQLDDGVRGIKLSAISSARDSSVHLCHTFCEVLDAGPAVETLDEIAFWLSNNPKEVVTIMWNNIYNIDASEIAQSYEASSIMPYAYSHKELDPWPTLQELIDSGKRVVNFIDSKPDEEKYPWLMYQFSRVFETPYENTDLNSFNCNIDRVVPDLNPNDLMYVMNHFFYGVIDMAAFKIQIPMRNKAKLINGQLLLDHTSNCTEVHRKKPTFIEVDFYTVGQALQLTASLNDAEFSGVKSDIEMETILDIFNSHESSLSIHESSLSPTEHIQIEITRSSSSSIFDHIFTTKANLIVLLTYLYLIAA
ncbi:hypothetical protein G6F56_007039 [Rhizopus delemar]|nr:hypothetical protein G6F56_007039 [Rhizopus delemar]